MADIKDVTCVYWTTPLDIGDTCTVGVQFMYKGPATTRKIYAAIGNAGWAGFDEVLSAEKDIDIPASFPPGSWSSIATYVYIPITSAIDPGVYDLYAKVRIAWVGWEVGQTYENVIVIGGGAPPEEIVDFSLSKPTAYPESAPPGPVLITCPVTSKSTAIQTAVVKCLVYEGSILPGHGTKLWESTKTITISPNETKAVQFMITSIVGTIDRRDVEVEVRVGGQLIEQDEWDDIYYVTVVAEPQKGKIETKELEIMGDQKYPLPVSVAIPQGSKAKVHVVMRNTGAIKFKPGMVWHIKGPDGNEIPGGTYDHQAWVSAHPDETSHFFEAIATFELNDIGDYSIEIWLLDQDNNTLDYWQGKLCTVSEVEPPPEEGTFSGAILEVKPLTFEFGELVKLLVTFTAYARGWTAQILWETRLTATLDGLSGSDSQNHTGEDGSRNEQPLHLGSMPNKNLTGEVILEARVSFPYTWKELFRIPISVTVPGVEPPPPEECVIGTQKCERGDLYECVSGPDYNYYELIEENSPECEGKEFPWIAAALIAGGGAVAIAAATRKRKKKS